MTENSAKSIIEKAIEETCPSIHERAENSDIDYVELTRMQEACSRSISDLLDEISKEIEKRISDYSEELEELRELQYSTLTTQGNIVCEMAELEWVQGILQKKKQELEK